MTKRNVTSVAMALVMSAFLGAASLFGGAGGCGSSAGGGGTGTGTGNIAGVTVDSITSTGDFTPGLSFYVAEDGGLGIRANAMDTNGDGEASPPTITTVTVTGATAALKSVVAADDVLDCTDGEASSSAATAVGVGISLDTTASMGSTVGPIADGLAQLATDLSAAGFTGTFAGVTLGDAFATKLASGSGYDGTVDGTKGEPPAFDSDERPDTGTTPVSAATVSAFFTQVADVVGSGADGGDGTENYLGPLAFLNSDITFAAGTQKVLISVGDNCSHTAESFADFADSGDWTPPALAAATSTFAGTVVHVIGPADPFCADDEFDMSELSTATGGIFKDITECDTEEEVTGCVEDFLASINTAISSGVAEECDIEAESGTITLEIVVEGEGDTSATATVALTVTAE